MAGIARSNESNEAAERSPFCEKNLSEQIHSSPAHRGNFNNSGCRHFFLNALTLVVIVTIDNCFLLLMMNSL